MILTISENTYRRLQEHAKPFEDTPESVIIRMMDFYEINQDSDRRYDAGLIRDDGFEQKEISFSVDNLPGLSKTSISEVLVGGEFTSYRTWSGVLELLLVKTWQAVRSIRGLNSICPVLRIVSGLRSDDGYRPIRSIGISFQETDIKTSCIAIDALASGMNIEVKVKFVRQPDAASRDQGGKGCLVLGGNKPRSYMKRLNRPTLSEMGS